MLLSCPGGKAMERSGLLYSLAVGQGGGEQEEVAGGHGGGGEQERHQVGRVAEAERDRASDTQLKVVSWCCICNGFFSFLFLVSIFLIINNAG